MDKYLKTSLVLLTISLLYLKNTPKSINSTYGYRTPQSIDSQLKWNYANNTASKFFVLESFVLIIFTAICKIYKFNLVKIFYFIAVGGLIFIVLFIELNLTKI
jgi:hypothetical protein